MPYADIIFQSSIEKLEINTWPPPRYQAYRPGVSVFALRAFNSWTGFRMRRPNLMNNYMYVAQDVSVKCQFPRVNF